MSTDDNQQKEKPPIIGGGQKIAELSVNPVIDTSKMEEIDLNEDTTREPPTEPEQQQPAEEPQIQSQSSTEPEPERPAEGESQVETSITSSTSESINESVPESVQNSTPTITTATPHEASSSTASSQHRLEVVQKHNRRSPSIALSVSSTSTGHQTVSASVFIKKALETIKNSKDARKISTLENAIHKAIKQFDVDPYASTSPAIVFEPLKIVCAQSTNNELKVVALDCIGKLFTFSYFEDAEPPKVDSESGITPPPSVPLIDRVVASICDNFKSEDIDPNVELQIIKALLAAVLNEDLVVHGKTLLNSIRKTYFICVRSRSPSNQAVAQATLTQMVNVVFERVKSFMNLSNKSNKSSILDVSLLRNGSIASDVIDEEEEKEKEEEEEKEGSRNGNGSGGSGESSESSESSKSTSNGSNTTKPTNVLDDSQPQLTLSSMTQKTITNRHSIDDDRILREDTPDNTLQDFDSSDLIVKDAFLVFRTMCMLTEKPLDDDGTNLKSQALRTKLLTLHLVHTILKTHMSVFASNNIYIKSSNKGDEKFVIAIKDYICSMLARNAASISTPVFEISAEIFWLIWSNLRSQFKKEISVFLSEIYFPILEMKTSTIHQKQYFLSILQRVCNDPRALVEIYLNYDCDRNAPVNIYEHIIDVLVRMAITPVHLTQLQLQNYFESKNKPHLLAAYNLSLPPAVAINLLTSQGHHENVSQFPLEYSLKMVSLDSLVAVLRSLLTWSQRGIAAVLTTNNSSEVDTSDVNGGITNHGNDSNVDLDESNTSASGTITPNGKPPPSLDDPSQFESLKHRKAALSGAIREFNFKPKRGLERLLREGFIQSKEPIEVAKFLLFTEGLDKATIGDFLGDDDQYHISIMHEFVDLMDFKNHTFVDALRKFLQSFRLPGESQKIDRYMLKFAERFISDNPAVFANADTPYILAYSVIMLNTDLHNPEIKKRMTSEEFIRNNRGINDSHDLPEEFLLSIYNEILNNEITLLSEQHAAILSSGGTRPGTFASNLGLALATVGRDLQREAYMQASKEMSSKTEQLFKRLISTDDNGNTEFYIASHIEHVRPMFEFAWMSFLAGLSGPFQESEEPDVVKLCMEGLRLAIRISCLFDIELARISFVSALAKFTNLQNLNEMKLKNVEAVKMLLNISLTEGNMLKSSWKDVLTCISQLERFLLIASGIEARSIPDVTNARLASRDSIDRARNFTLIHNHNIGTNYDREVGKELQASNIEVDMDKIFTQSSQLSGEAIVDFVKALTEVSSEEIQSSGNSVHPRMFSLQKMVDVSYYNMERIRVEWSQLWIIMGQQFNKMASHENTSVVSFALDSLRQLSLRFFDLEELSHFKFQKDFLKPFEYTMKNNNNKAAKELVLDCIQQMILAKSDRIRSGWSTMFAVFSAGANVEFGSIVQSSYDLTKKIYDENIIQVINQGGFGDLMLCLSSLAKNPRNPKYQKISLHAVDLLKNAIEKIPSFKEDNEAGIKDEYNELWFPILHSLHDIIMNGEDLEVRSRALNYLFDILTTYGGQFEPSFWDSICRKLLFPIFIVLKSRSSKTQDELSVWLSTTMIQALRNMIALLTYYFDTLERMLDGFLELLVTCIDQENDTVSRIGSSCVLQLVSHNVEKLTNEHWSLIVDKLEYLFKTTTAHELLDNSLLRESETNHSRSNSIEDDNTNGTSPAITPTKQRSKTRPSKFRTTIVRSILQLLMIDTVEELFKNEDVFKRMPTDDILRLSNHLKASYQFARKFNDNRELRLELWRQGFMKQMPNLLRQESTSALTYVGIMMKLYKDTTKLENGEQREEVEIKLIPLCVEIIKGYNQLQPSDERYVNTLSPVVVEILNQYSGFSTEDFEKNITDFYPVIIGLLDKDLSPDLRLSIKKGLNRLGEIKFN